MNAYAPTSSQLASNQALPSLPGKESVVKWDLDIVYILHAIFLFAEQGFVLYVFSITESNGHVILSCP